MFQIWNQGFGLYLCNSTPVSYASKWHFKFGHSCVFCWRVRWCFRSYFYQIVEGRRPVQSFCRRNCCQSAINLSERVKNWYSFYSSMARYPPKRMANKQTRAVSRSQNTRTMEGSYGTDNEEDPHDGKQYFVNVVYIYMLIAIKNTCRWVPSCCFNAIVFE